MTKSVEPALFDFVDEFAGELRAGHIERSDSIESSSEILTFCESFFDQFFAGLDSQITGFGRRSKRGAATLAERMRRDDKDGTEDARKIIVAFEEFCDMHSDLSSNYSEGSNLSYETFHEDYLTRLMDLALAWARTSRQTPLAERIAQSQQEYEAAIEESEWLTRTRRKKSVWQKLTSRGRTSS